MPKPRQEPENPQDLPNVTPDIFPQTSQIRFLLGSLEQLQQDVRKLNSERLSNFLWYIGIFCAGFVLLATMLIFGYLRLDDKVSSLTQTSIRVDTKLEDLLQRIPPITQAPKHP